MIAELLESLPAELSAFVPAPPASDRAFWGSLSEKLASKVLEHGDSFLGYAWPPLPATLFLDFNRTGNRSRYEEPYFIRRIALCALVLAECVRADGRYLDDIMNGIDAVCSETAWQLPAHNGYVRDTPQLPLPDVARPVLDLFACETGALLATVRHLLRDRLDAVSPFICERILRITKERIVKPYLTRHFWWMGRGREPMNNWTVWCTQNVLLTAFTTGLSQRELHAVIRKAARSIDFFLKDYGDDGCCSEGAQYYRHAGLCLWGCLEIMNAVSGGTFVPVFREEKIRNIALYILNVHVHDRYYFNFADCSPVAGRAGAREFLFGNRIGSDALSRCAARDAALRPEPDLPEEINLFYRLLELMTADQMACVARGAVLTEPAGVSAEDASPGAGLAATSGGRPSNDGPRPDVWYPSVGVFIARSPRFSLAVKAGGNGDSHNHNDTGSVILYKDGKPCLIDVGVETYTARTFSPRRYEIWTMQSAYHNLPSFGPYQQRDGSEYRARDVQITSSGVTSEISMELAGAYPVESGVKSYRRTVRLERPPAVDTDSARVSDLPGRDAYEAREAVVIRDRYEGGLPAVLSLMTSEPPEVMADGSVALGTLALLETELPPDRITVEPIPIADLRLRAAWPGTIYRLLFRINDVVTLTIS